MWHDGIRWLAENPPSTDAAPNIIVALIGMGGTAIGGAFLLLNTLVKNKKEPAEPPAPVPAPPPPVPLNSDADDEQDHALRDRNRVLERWCYRNHIDPTLIINGTEALADVRIPA